MMTISTTWTKIEELMEELHELEIGERMPVKDYLKELDDLESFLRLEEVELINEYDAFLKILDSVDFYMIDYNGRFCQLAIVQNFNQRYHWYLYLVPVDQIV